MFKILLIFLVIFTLLDIFITRLGLSLGCLELNAFVNNVGLDLWSVSRLFLLAYLLVIYSVGYKKFRFESIRGLGMLKNSLYVMDIFIGGIVFSGIFHVISKIMV
jgi:hypothetical protein